MNDFWKVAIPSSIGLLAALVAYHFGRRNVKLKEAEIAAARRDKLLRLSVTPFFAISASEEPTLTELHITNRSLFSVFITRVSLSTDQGPKKIHMVIAEFGKPSADGTPVSPLQVEARSSLRVPLKKGVAATLTVLYRNICVETGCLRSMKTTIVSPSIELRTNVPWLWYPQKQIESVEDDVPPATGRT